MGFGTAGKIEFHFAQQLVVVIDEGILSQTLAEDERDYHFLLPTQPKHRTVLLAFETQFRRFLIDPYEWHASLPSPRSYSEPPKRT